MTVLSLFRDIVAEQIIRVGEVWYRTVRVPIGAKWGQPLKCGYFCEYSETFFLLYDYFSPMSPSRTFGTSFPFPFAWPVHHDLAHLFPLFSSVSDPEPAGSEFNLGLDPDPHLESGYGSRCLKVGIKSLNLQQVIVFVNPLTTRTEKCSN
jgi:hypothetical protein